MWVWYVGVCVCVQYVYTCMHGPVCTCECMCVSCVHMSMYVPVCVNAWVWGVCSLLVSLGRGSSWRIAEHH